MSWFRHTALAFALLLGYSASFAETDSAQRLEDVNAEIKQLSATVEANKQQRDALYRQLKKQSQAVSASNRRLRELNHALADKNAELAKLEKQQQAFEKSQASHLAALEQQLKSAFLHAQPHYLKILLNQQDPSSLSRANTYYHYFHAARQEQIEQITTALQDLDSYKTEIVVAKREQQSLVEQQQQKQATLEQQKADRLATTKRLETKLANDNARIAALKEEAAALKELLQSLPASAPSALPDIAFAKLKGKLVWPRKGKVVSHYGSSRHLGQLKWQGIMIKSPVGGDVVSAAGGRVVFSDWLRGFGLLLIIDHGDKYMTLYGNNQSLLKAEGDIVQAGELIALSGNQGIKQSDGLYFEIRHKGNPTDPVKWLGRKS